MSPFERMRADLIARGLIDREHRLTPAGNQHAAAIIQTLKREREAPPPRGAVTATAR